MSGAHIGCQKDSFGVPPETGVLRILSSTIDPEMGFWCKVTLTAFTLELLVFLNQQKHCWVEMQDVGVRVMDLARVLFSLDVRLSFVLCRGCSVMAKILIILVNLRSRLFDAITHWLWQLYAVVELYIFFAFSWTLIIQQKNKKKVKQIEMDKYNKIIYKYIHYINLHLLNK